MMFELNTALRKCVELYGEDQPFLDPQTGTLTLAGCVALHRLNSRNGGSKLEPDLLNKLRNSLSALQ